MIVNKEGMEEGRRSTGMEGMKETGKEVKEEGICVLWRK